MSNLSIEALVSTYPLTTVFVVLGCLAALCAYYEFGRKTSNDRKSPVKN